MNRSEGYLCFYHTSTLEVSNYFLLLRSSKNEALQELFNKKEKLFLKPNNIDCLARFKLKPTRETQDQLCKL